MDELTIIAEQTVVSGRVAGSGDLTVEGRVDGSVELTDATLTIAESGVVTGDVQAQQVILAGQVQGTVAAAERVELTSTARAEADITSPLVAMADGALLSGELTVGVDSDVSASAARPATASARRPSASTRRTASTTRATPAAPAARPPSSGTATAAATTSSTVTTTVVEEATEVDEDDSTDGAEEIDVEQIREDYTVKELRSKLRDLDLQVSGTKDELIERLLDAEGETVLDHS